MADEHGSDRERAQADGVHPIGRALRATFDAENHDSLGSDLTGLMLALARVEPPAASPPVPAPTPAAPPRRWWSRWFSAR